MKLEKGLDIRETVSFLTHQTTKKTPPSHPYSPQLCSPASVGSIDCGGSLPAEDFPCEQLKIRQRNHYKMS